MPSYADEQKRRAVEAVEECGGSVTRAMRRLGYPTRQTLYHWLNRDLREEPPDQVDVEEGVQPGRLGDGGILRQAQEYFHHRGWSGVTMPGFCRMLDAYPRYYNEGRPMEKLGWLSPMQYRRSLGLAA